MIEIIRPIINTPMPDELHTMTWHSLGNDPKGLGPRKR